MEGHTSYTPIIDSFTLHCFPKKPIPKCNWKSWEVQEVIARVQETITNIGRVINYRLLNQIYQGVVILTHPYWHKYDSFVQIVQKNHIFISQFLHSLINTTKKCFCFVLFASPYLYNKKCVSVHYLIKVHNGKVFLWCIWVRYIMKMWLRCAILSDTQQICGFVVYLIGIHNKITFSLNKHTTKKCTSHIGWNKEIRSGNNKKGKVKLEMGCEPNGGEKWRWQWVGREGGGVGV